MWLDPIPGPVRQQAISAIEAGDANGFICSASNEDGLDLVFRNIAELRERGLYERALLCAFGGPRTNNHRWPLDVLRMLFDCADRARLLAAGDPLPGPGPFTVYRGVAGRGRARRVRGFSWTGSLRMAAFFAHRFPMLADPAVFTARVRADQVLAYLHSAGRNESEFVINIGESDKVRRVPRADVVAALTALRATTEANK